MNIRDKLRFIEAIQQPRKPEPQKPVSTESLDSILNGKLIETEAGPAFVVTKEYELSHEHGLFPLQIIEDVSPQFLQLAGKDENLLNLDVHKAIFFDTETTGLAGGSGTYIFLAGLGFFAENKFMLKQFFLRDFPDEPAMLHAIGEITNDYRHVISFNGKSYDWPLLQTRFTYNRMRITNPDPLHFDLLHASRRIWKNSLPDCSLGSLERNVLRVQRNGDIPSFLIPQMYFEYLRTKDATPLKPVFYHNEIDILSLITLSILLHNIHENPMEHLSNPAELLSLASHYDAMEQWERNIHIYDQLFHRATNPQNKLETGIRLGYCHKRLGRWDDALQLWEQLTSLGNFRIEPYEEMAKYFEHRKCDFQKAEQIVHKALAKLDIVEQLRPDTQLAEFRESLTHRLNRLLRKISSQEE